MQNNHEIVQTVVNNPELLNEVIDTKQAQTIIVQRAEMSLHEGPLPSPQSMAQYAEHIPDFGERIMRYAEKEQQARHDFTQQSLQLNRLGLYFGVIALLVITLFCGWLASLGNIEAAAWVMAAVLAAVVGIFVIGKHKENP